MKEKVEMELLVDTPAGTDEADQFHHEGYAKTLADIFVSNAPGICVGLFGKWGHGKSTVVNLLKRYLPSDTRLIVFNAWKSRGDSVRRQMLIELLRQTESPRYEEFKRFTSCSLPLELRTLQEQHQYSNSRIHHLLFFDTKLDWWIVAAVGVAGVSLLLAIALVVGAWLRWPITLNLTFTFAALIGLISSCMTIVRRWFEKKKDKLVVFSQPVSESQRLALPEQFEEVFRNEVHKFCSGEHKIILVVDDIDRCEPNTVIEALAAVRQFSKPETTPSALKCQFLIPCDEQQVILALESDGYRTSNDGKYHDYQKEELLRKFFDIVVRMDAFLDRDITRYAGEMADKISLPRADAQELIDMVEPHDPRQVKKLLNAYKVTLQRVAQNQAAHLLPEDSAMPDKKRTILLMVALRETVPSIYEWIAGDVPRVNELAKSQVAVPNALLDAAVIGHRIVTRAGRISDVTLEYLVTGRYELELRNLPVGGRFALAVKHSDNEEFKKILAEANNETTEKLIAWLVEWIRRCHTTSRLTGCLAQCVEYAAEGEETARKILPAVEACSGHGPLLQQALSGFRQLEEVARLVPLLAPDPRARILDAILANFFSDPSSHDPELQFILSNALMLTKNQQHRFRNWLTKYIQDQDLNKEQQKLDRLASALPVDTKKCWGLAPEMGAYLAGTSWQVDQKESSTPPEKWPKARLIPVLIGNNAKSAEQALVNLFVQSGPLGSPVQISEPSLGFKPGFRAAREILKVVEAASLSKVFLYFEKWLAKQTEPVGARIILDALQSRLLEFGEREISVVGDALARLLVKRPSELSFCDYIGAKPKGKAQAEMWQRFCCSTFQGYAANLKGQPGLNESHIAFLKCIGDLKWPVHELADDLMAVKIEQLPNGTQNIEGWAKALKPLLAHGTDKTKGNVLREISKRRQYVREALLVGLVVLWADALDEAAATAIANWCCDNENQIPNVRGSLDKVAETKGGGRMIEILVELLNEDRQWLSRYPRLLEFVAVRIALTGNEYQLRFQRKIKQLILSDQEAVVTTGLNLLKGVQVLDPSVRAEIERLQKKFPGDAIKVMCKSLLSKAK